MIEPQWFGMQASAWQQLISILVLMVMLVPSAIGDYQRQKVPNWLSMSGWILGPVVAWGCTGLSGVSDALLGLGFMVALFFPLWMLHWFGAADVKLMGSVGALTGIADAPAVLLGVLLAGLVLGSSMLLYKRGLYPLWKRMVRRSGAVHDFDTDLVSEPIVLPYAIPIAFGTMLTILYLLL